MLPKLSALELMRPRTRQARYRRWLRRGLAIVALLYAIDPEWPLHLRRCLLVLWTIFGRSSGFVLLRPPPSAAWESGTHEPR